MVKAAQVDIYLLPGPTIALFCCILPYLEVVLPQVAIYLSPEPAIAVSSSLLPLDLTIPQVDIYSVAL